MTNTIDSMLNVTANKLAKPWGSTRPFTDVKWGDTITAEADGMAQIHMKPSAEGAYLIVADITENWEVLTTGRRPNQDTFRMWFPVQKGHVYKIDGNLGKEVKIAFLYFFID